MARMGRPKVFPYKDRHDQVGESRGAAEGVVKETPLYD